MASQDKPTEGGNVQELTKEQALELLQKTNSSSAGKEYSRVYSAVRDPANANRVLSISVHERAT